MSNTPFDPSKFTVPKAKPLPIILLLDVSASMSGDKIRNLNDAVRDMLDTFRGSESSENEIWVSIITFGSQVNLHQPLASAGDIQWQALSASGTTPLGVALDMAKAMIEDKDVVPSRAYRPTVVLVSDGQPDSGWKEPLNRFVSDGRSAKCDRMAIAIGVDADKAVLGQFIEGTQNDLFYAENAKQLRDRFKFVTMSVVIRTKSQTPNTLPAASEIEDRQVSLEPQPQPQNTSDDDGGYW